MVSPLWKACSDGDIQKVHELLNEPSAVDIELKDHTGVTPLIEAVRNGHVEVVKYLLDKGADPHNGSMQGPSETYSSDPAILELLHAAQSQAAPNGVPSHHLAYNNHDGHDDPEKRFYAPPPPDAYTYYPTINPTLSTVNEAGAYYPPPPQHSVDGGSPNGVGHLPPPEVARMIPCRYFPACRYGAQCMFAHPQTPYYQGPMPPVQFPPYDPMGNPYVPQYYPPPSFQQPPSAHSMAPMSPPPGPPIMHARNPSEVTSPAPTGHFSPNGIPPPVPYGPMSPPHYAHPGQGPVPMPMPTHHSQPPHPHQVPHSPPNMYNAPISPVPPPPFPLLQDGSFIPQGPPPNVNYPEVAPNGAMSSDMPQAENYNNHPNPPNGASHQRRGSGRRFSFSKPPCLFFPSGRCKNGDDCRFPHILPDGQNAPRPSYPGARGGTPRPPRGAPHVNGVNGLSHLEAKLSNLTMRDDQVRQKNGVDGSSRSHSSDAGNRPKFQSGPKHAGLNGHNNHKKLGMTKQQQQRVPNADEFPVLAGATTPPKLGNGHAHNGLTAAQILQGARKDASKESSTRGTTPDPVRGHPSKEVKTDLNGSAQEHTVPAPEHPAPVDNSVNKHPVMSFAAAATSGTNEISKEVSVSA